MTRGDPWQVFRLELEAATDKLQRAVGATALPAPKPPGVGGRPRVSGDKELAVRLLLQQGVGVNRTAAAIGVGIAAVMRVKGEMA